MMSAKPKAKECEAKGCTFFVRTTEFGRRGDRGWGKISKCFCQHWNTCRSGLVSGNEVCPKEL